MPSDTAAPRQRVRLTLSADSPTYGGAEHHFATLVEHLPVSYHVSLLLAGGGPDRLAGAGRAAGADVTAVSRVDGKFDVGGLRRLRRSLARSSPDLVHVSMSSASNNRHLLMLAVARRAPTVVTVHGFGDLGSRAQLRTMRPAFRRVQAAMVTSRAIGAQLVDDLAIPADRVVVLRSGVAEREPVQWQARDSGSSQAPIEVVSVGRLSAEKGHDVLVAAVRRLTEQGVPLAVTVVGDGPERPELERRAAGLPIRFVGAVDDPWPYLDGADLFCLPSRSEGLPLALLEAMMAGLPCVATSVGDIPDLAPDVLTVPPDDPAALAAGLRSLIDDPTRRAALGAEGRHRALTGHTLTAMVGQVLDVYGKALDR